MPDLIENYIPQSAVGKMRNQAFIVWSVFSFIILLWILLITLAPIAEANHLTGISAPIYKFFSYLCHQNPVRSLHIYETAFAVCSRCFGVYFGLFFGFIVYPLFRPIQETEPLPRFWLFLALIPMAIDWLLGVFEIWRNTHLSRFLTGALLGTACALFIVPALIEVFQLLPYRRKVKRLSARQPFCI